jgi:hypothetical protein
MLSDGLTINKGCDLWLRLAVSTGDVDECKCREAY